MVVLETPKPVRAPELYTRTPQRTWLEIEARNGQEEENLRGLRNWIGRIENLGKPAVDAGRVEG
ncbi:transcription initiation factor TFIID subunit 12-like [Pyrus ussuriensis x Pyrus communis]|uniref:Transcription initiation factor TFIID subunit 12-like n=1 Tax=Pyrus ussuriensis x Pyrus communis TaxID=2448454 RepID=A0A5N5HVU4_9ROSA|nr:transcription initiation factor TFIID subunit 12-like [Pyrus ussuriensis x Pyrus communis]